jgi:ADP-heptose:LPS heptosyltransferase
MSQRADGRPLLVAYRALGLGDFLTAVPALRALAAAFPGHRRVLAAQGAITALAELSGAVEEVVDVRPLAPLPAALHGADVAVNLHGRGPQSDEVLLATGPRRLVAFGVPGLVAGPEWRAQEHEVHRWCRLLRESGIPADPRALDLPTPPWPPPGIARGATLVHPGTSLPAKCWPAERWGAVARAEAEAGRAVAVTGGPDERELGERVAHVAGLPHAIVLAGRTDLRDLTAAVAAAGRVVCGDTGIAHLATALGTPSVILFGPVSPTVWAPPPDRPQHRVLWSGRTGDPARDGPDPGLLAITPQDVLAALAALPG